MQIKHYFLIIFLFISLNILGNQDSPFVRFPAINNDGDILFVYQGDIWKIPANTKTAIRLTIHEGYDSAPMWSDDGKHFAFSSDRYGNNDIFISTSDGNSPKRLTFNSANDILTDFAKNGEIVFATSREFQQVEWNHEFYSISENGGTEKRILNSVGEMATISPDGNMIAFTTGVCPTSRENYHGSANLEIWLYNRKTDTFRQLTNFDGNDFMPRWADNSNLFFISAKSGIYNIFQMNIGEPDFPNSKQITNFENDGIRYFNISPNGKTIVFERFTDIFKLDVSSKSVGNIEINLGADFRIDPFQNVTSTNGISEYAISPNGKYAAFVIHGEIFISQTEPEKSKTINITNNSYRDENPIWLNDSTIIFSSDKEGNQRDLFLVKSADKTKPDLFKTFSYHFENLTNSKDDESFPVISPDRKKLVYEINVGKLVAFDISPDGKLSNKITLLDGWSAPQNVCFSPDSRWIAYAQEDLEFNQELFIQPIDGKISPVNISMHPKQDGNPFWSQDGSKLIFTSNRKQNSDIWFVWLNAKDWQKTEEDWKEFSDEKEDKSDKKDKKKKKDESETDEIEPIKIDLENIWERLVQVTDSPKDEFSPAASKDGKTIYYSSPTDDGKEREMKSIQWDKTKPDVVKGITNPTNFQYAENGKVLFAIGRGGKLFRIKDATNKAEVISINAKYVIDREIENKQIFNEAWRTLNYGFYDPNFHGHNWEMLRKHYEPMVLKASTKRDFRDMFNNMLGQLNASHMGLYGKDNLNTQKETTGLLGIEIQPNGNSVEIVRVIPNSPANKDESKLFVGDKIIAVNGKLLDNNINFYSLFSGKAGEIMELKISDKDGKERTVLIRPIDNLKNLLYNEWVLNNQKLVNKLSDGKIGYLHIKEMGWESFEVFERDLTAAGYGKEGLVIDVRYNGGGWTTDYLMMALNYKQHAYTIPRGATDNLEENHTKFRDYYPLGERLPYSAWTKKSIALCNSKSYSNAEIFSHAYKSLEIGKLVGEPTFGAVISTGAKTLIDDSYVRLPSRGWFTLKTGINQENGAAIPDFVLYNNPDDKAKGKDTQLEKAVEILLNQK